MSGSWICELLPHGADRCGSARDIVRDADALNLSPSGAVVAMVFGLSLIVLVVSVPVAVGSEARRWAAARHAGPLDQVLISWAAGIVVGLPLVTGILTAMMSVPSAIGRIVAVVIAGMACGLLLSWRARRPVAAAGHNAGPDSDTVQ